MQLIKTGIVALLCLYPALLRAQTPLKTISYSARVVYDGKPVPSVSVQAKQANTSTTSDNNGRFSISLRLPDTLVVSATGYATELIPINAEAINLLNTINLQKQGVKLDEVIVNTGYQQVSKQNSTGSFTRIDNSLLNQRPGADVLSRLDGIAAGYQFDRRAGSREKLQIRGLSSLRTGTTDPLIVLDNFPYEGDVNSINPADVESITILKDASAAAIWGARAGNGVIVITTKKGQYNRPMQIGVSSNVVLSKLPDLVDVPVMSSGSVIEAEQFLFNKGFYNADLSNTTSRPALTPVVELLALQRSGAISLATMNARLAAYAAIDNRQDYERYIYRNGLLQQNQFSLNGGGSNNRYSFSGGYDRSSDVLRGNDYRRISLRSDNSFRLNQRLEFSTGLYYTNSLRNNNSPGGYGSYKIGTKSLPPYVSFIDSLGNPAAIALQYRAGFTDTAGAGRLLDWKYRPLDELVCANNCTTGTDLLISGSLKYTVLKGLSAELSGQYQWADGTTKNLRSQQAYYTRDQINRFSQISAGQVKYILPAGGILDLSKGRTIAPAGRLQLNYIRSFAKMTITALGGGEIRQVRNSGMMTRTYGYNEDLAVSSPVDLVSRYPVYASLSGTAQIPNANSFSATLGRYVSVYSNVLARYNNRYSISASARKDASNIFGVKSNQRWKPLWSVGGAWKISDEGFYHSKLLPYLNARISYGKSGNIASDVSAYTTINYRDPSLNLLTSLPSAIVANLPNPFLRWQSVGMLNAGIDFSLKNRRISGSIDCYRKNTKDLLGSESIDPTTGTATMTTNSAWLKGSGVDVELTSTNLDRAVKWQTGLLFSYVTTKITRYLIQVPDVAGNLVGDGLFIAAKEGLKPYTILAYRWGGLNSFGNPMGYLNDTLSTDYTKIKNASAATLAQVGPALPPVYGAIRNSFSWKQLSLNINTSYRLGYYFMKPAFNYTSLFNQLVGTADYNKRWQKPGDEYSTNVPAMLYPLNTDRELFYQFSEVNVLKADNWRVDYINLSWELNKKTMKRFPLRQVLFNLYASNLNWIIWKANKEGLDPDYPGLVKPAKSFGAGVSIQF